MPISLDDLSYPFDPTGTLASNLISNEQAVINAVNYSDYHITIPRWAPYFLDSMQITIRETDGTVRPAVMGIDWYGNFEFISASRACAAPIWGGVSWLNTQLAGVVSMTYQTLGGVYTIDEAKISELLAYALHDPRVTAWEEVVDQPSVFPPIDHEWDLVDLVGASEIVTALQGIEAAIRASGGSDFEAHIMNLDNPHQTNALQVGLGNVQNYPIASAGDLASGTSNIVYVTPAGVSTMIGGAGGPTAALAQHIADHDNPHDVDADQVNAYDKPTIDQMLTNYLSSTSVAADSVLFNGRDENAYAAFVLAQTAANAVLFDGLNTDQYKAQVLQGTAANSLLLGGKSAAELLSGISGASQKVWIATASEVATDYWEELGQMPVPTDAVPAGWPDTRWLLSGGGANGELADGFYLISISARGPSNSPVTNMSVVNLAGNAPAATFGYTVEAVDDGTGTGTTIQAVRVWMHTGPNRDEMTGTLCSANAGVFLADTNRVTVAPVSLVAVPVNGYALQSDLLAVVTAVTESFTTLTAAATGGA